MSFCKTLEWEHPFGKEPDFSHYTLLLNEYLKIVKGSSKLPETYSEEIKENVQNVIKNTQEVAKETKRNYYKIDNKFYNVICFLLDFESEYVSKLNPSEITSEQIEYLLSALKNRDKTREEYWRIASSLFQQKDITLHSGQKSYFKIDCDNLTDHDINTIALIISKKVKFNKVIGVPRGGIRLATALEKYKADPEDYHATKIIIVDDVLTTGTSMQEAYLKLTEAFTFMGGYVIFARGECPSWIQPIFQFNPFFLE